MLIWRERLRRRFVRNALLLLQNINSTLTIRQLTLPGRASLLLHPLQCLERGDFFRLFRLVPRLVREFVLDNPFDNLVCGHIVVALHRLEHAQRLRRRVPILACHRVELDWLLDAVADGGDLGYGKETFEKRDTP